jgi:uncharacterized protein YggT (Ycf19 family)
VAEPRAALPLRRLRPLPRLFRRVLPPVGPLDLSPMVALFVLYILQRVLVSLLEGL